VLYGMPQGIPYRVSLSIQGVQDLYKQLVPHVSLIPLWALIHKGMTYLAHGSRPHLSSLRLSTPGPAALQQGWYRAPCSPFLPDQGSRQARPTCRTGPNPALACPCFCGDALCQGWSCPWCPWFSCSRQLLVKLYWTFLK